MFMLNRFWRLIILVLFTVFMYMVLFNDTMLSYVIPQIQVTFVGLTKGALGALFGGIIGMVLFPHKVDWSQGVSSAGAWARLALIVVFMYIAFYYA